MNKRRLIIVFIITIIFVVVGILFVQEKKKLQQKEKEQLHTRLQQEEGEEQQNTEIDTSDWKTYVSEGWGYSIKYPSNLYIKITPQGDRFPGDTIGDEIMPKGEIFQDGGQTLIISDIEKMGVQDIMPNEKIHVTINTFKLNSNYHKGKTWEQYFNDSENSLFKTKINGSDAYYGGPNLGQDGSVSFAVFIVKDNWIYNLDGINLVDKKIDSQSMQIMQKIIETFEFRNN